MKRESGNLLVKCPDCDIPFTKSGLYGHRKGKRCLCDRTILRWTQLGFVPVRSNVHIVFQNLLRTYPPRRFYEAQSFEPTHEKLIADQPRSWIRPSLNTDAFIALDFMTYYAGGPYKNGEGPKAARADLGHYLPYWLYEIYLSTKDIWYPWAKDHGISASKMLFESHQFYLQIGSDLKLRASAISACRTCNLTDHSLVEALIDMTHQRKSRHW